MHLAIKYQYTLYTLNASNSISFKTFLPKKKSILHVYYMHTMSLFINISEMIILSVLVGKFSILKHFYVFKLRNIKFLLQTS